MIRPRTNRRHWNHLRRHLSHRLQNRLHLSRHRRLIRRHRNQSLHYRLTLRSRPIRHFHRSRLKPRSQVRCPMRHFAIRSRPTGRGIHRFRNHHWLNQRRSILRRWNLNPKSRPRRRSILSTRCTPSSRYILSSPSTSPYTTLFVTMRARADRRTHCG
jgi:hypothetical protein